MKWWRVLLTGLLWLLYTIHNAIWLQQHRIRLYGVLGILSKKSDWMCDTTLTFTITRASAVLRIKEARTPLRVFQ